METNEEIYIWKKFINLKHSNIQQACFTISKYNIFSNKLGPSGLRGITRFWVRLVLCNCNVNSHIHDIWDTFTLMNKTPIFKSDISLFAIYVDCVCLRRFLVVCAPFMACFAHFAASQYPEYHQSSHQLIWAVVISLLSHDILLPLQCLFFTVIHRQQHKDVFFLNKSKLQYFIYFELNEDTSVSTHIFQWSLLHLSGRFFVIVLFFAIF